jgi:hypothetical protein
MALGLSCSRICGPNSGKQKTPPEKSNGYRNLSCSPIVNAIPVRIRSGIRWSDVAIGSTPPWQLISFLPGDLQDLYMTTALADGTRIEEEVGARVLRLRTDTPGVPEFFSRLGV